MSEIKSSFRIPASELGRAKDQTPTDAFYKYRHRENWPWGGSVAPNGSLPLASETSSFFIYYRLDASGKTIRVFRNPAVHDEPARWTTIKEYQSLPKTKPQAGAWWNQWYYDFLAKRQDDLNDTSRFVSLPWDTKTFRTPTGTTDNGVLIDDDKTGIEGYETLGLRPSTPLDRLQINTRAGKEVILDGDWIWDGAARRTIANVGLYQGRGMGNIPKRVGILTADDMENGWNEAKALVLPNIQFGVGAKFVSPATRVEHTSKASRYKDHPNDTYPEGDVVTMIPHGTRFPTNISKAKAEVLADNLSLSGLPRKAFLNNIEGCNNFGLIVSETCSNTAIVEGSGLRDYARLDITSAICARMFNGVFVPGNFYTANPTPFELR